MTKTENLQTTNEEVTKLESLQIKVEELSQVTKMLHEKFAQVEEDALFASDLAQRQEWQRQK